jgi:type VI secretion system protein ImpA
MPTAPLLSEDLLDPISAEQPAGVDLRWTPEWDRIKEARRADDALEMGKWVKKERKSANWLLVQQLAASVLREKSKDLQIALWLMEANLKLHGFAGLRDSLRLTRELLARYWDNGLYPPIEDGPEDRAGPLQWLNDRMVDSIIAVPITARSDQGVDYGLIDLRDARSVGTEASWRSADGEVDPKKKKDYETKLADGHISGEMFERAVKESRRAPYEELSSDFRAANEEFQALSRIVDEKFGEAAPKLSDCRAAFQELEEEIASILERKRKEEPDVNPNSPTSGTQPPQPVAPEPVVVRFPIAFSSIPGSLPANGSWQQAEELIRSGHIDQGLAEMTRLAAHETSGRERFHRKLLLAEICLSSNRERLARSILEELAEQIDKLQLEHWESSELIASVWTRLYKLYRQRESDADRANKLYERLCKLDPWQALNCNES